MHFFSIQLQTPATPGFVDFQVVERKRSSSAITAAGHHPVDAGQVTAKPGKLIEFSTEK